MNSSAFLLLFLDQIRSAVLGGSSRLLSIQALLSVTFKSCDGTISAKLVCFMQSYQLISEEIMFSPQSPSHLYTYSVKVTVIMLMLFLTLHLNAATSRAHLIKSVALAKIMMQEESLSLHKQSKEFAVLKQQCNLATCFKVHCVIGFIFTGFSGLCVRLL